MTTLIPLQPTLVRKFHSLSTSTHLNPLELTLINVSGNFFPENLIFKIFFCNIFSRNFFCNFFRKFFSHIFRKSKKKFEKKGFKKKFFPKKVQPISTNFNPSYQNKTYFTDLPPPIYQRNKQASSVSWKRRCDGEHR